MIYSTNAPTGKWVYTPAQKLCPKPKNNASISKMGPSRRFHVLFHLLERFRIL